MGREAAGGVHQPLPRLVMCELSFTFRESLRRLPARARLCGFSRLCGAAQRYPCLSWTAPSAPRSSNSAILSARPFHAAKCSGVSLHGRRAGLGPARSTADADAERRTRSRPGRSRRRWHRRAIRRFGDCRWTPHSAARRSHTCCARRGRSEGVGPTGVPQRPAGTRDTKQQARPEGRLSVRFG